MAGYVYKGTQPIRPRGAPGGRPKTGLAPFNPDLCGTNAGYHQHYRHGQDKCQGEKPPASSGNATREGGL